MRNLTTLLDNLIGRGGWGRFIPKVTAEDTGPSRTAWERQRKGRRSKRCPGHPAGTQQAAPRPASEQRYLLR